MEELESLTEPLVVTYMSLIADIQIRSNIRGTVRNSRHTSDDDKRDVSLTEGAQ
jgi:hypothetical protein